MPRYRAPSLTGQRFGRLLVGPEIGKNKSGQRVYLCKCDCGQERNIAAPDLKRGNNKSCGCLRTMRNRQRYAIFQKLGAKT